MEPTRQLPDGVSTILVEAPLNARKQDAPTTRLVAGSGLQFIDFGISTDALSQTFGRFIEETDTASGPVLIPLDDRPDYDGVEWHPAVPQRALRPDETIWLTGFGALEPFLGSWLPIPYLRQIGSDDTGASRFDSGPMNWARIFLAAPALDLRQASSIEGVLAFDTRLSESGRLDQDAYLAPNLDDVRHGSEFRLVADPPQLGALLAEKWIETWLARAFSAWQLTATAHNGAAATTPRTSPFALEHIARYLTLLRTLECTARLPAIRFYDAFAPSGPLARGNGVDLYVDLGDDRTTALLADRLPSADGDAPAHVEMLSLRDLSSPTILHAGPFPTYGEFDGLSLGNAAISRLSGRPDAFFWPSPIRIGAEAARLSLRASAAPGVTGLGNLGSLLAETTSRDTPWRFSRDDMYGADPGPVVAGEVLAHLTEDGRVLGPGDASAPPALRPRFSPSSLLSLFIAELVLHALSEINAPSIDTPDRDVRRLHKIVVACPAEADDLTRQRLLERIAAGIELVWSAYGWNAGDAAVTPRKPQVALGLGTGLSAQLIYLYDEVQNRFAGNMRHFMGLNRGGDGASGGTGALSIATLDFAGLSTSLTIVDYELSAGGTVQPRLSMTDRCRIGRTSLSDAVLAEIVLPAIADGLAVARHPDPAAIIATLMHGQGTSDPHLSCRARHAILTPAANALLDLYSDLAEGRLSRGLRQFSLATLVVRGGGRLEPLAARIDDLAIRDGARDFRLADVNVPLLPRAFVRLFSEHLDPLVSRIAEIVREQSCDIILLSGPYARLAGVRSELLSRLPLAPHRMIDLGERRIALVDRLVDRDALVDHASATRILPAIGATLAVSGPLAEIAISLQPLEPGAPAPARVNDAGLRQIAEIRPLTLDIPVSALVVPPAVPTSLLVEDAQ